MKDFLLDLIEPLILWLGYADRETFSQILAVYDRRILALGDEIAAKDREIRDLNAEYGSILRKYATLKIAAGDFRAAVAKIGL